MENPAINIGYCNAERYKCPILVSHDGHFEQKWPPKYKNPPDLGGIWFPT
jgi:hypothetical protein